MEKKAAQTENSVVSNWAMELIISVALMLIGGLVIFDSLRMGGATWTSDGPGAGYLPFYIGILITLASGIIFIQTLIKKKAALGSFISTDQVRSVLSVFLPTILYVAAIKLAGIYITSAIFIAGFMWWFGKYSWLKIIPISVGISLFFFLIFEKWFLIPLPKGPLEKLLGY